MNIAEIDLLTLPSLPLAERRNLPNCPAIYFVIDGDQVLYIGKTVNLMQRWISHHRWQQLSNQSNSTRIAWLGFDETEISLQKEVEAVLIEYFNPELNGTACVRQTQTKSQRLGAILPDDVYEELLRFADTEKRTKSQMAAILIEEAIATRKAKTSPSSDKDKGVT